MTRGSRFMGLFAAAALALASTPALAQDEATTDDTMQMEGPTVEVSGVDYAFENLPTSVPAGTTLTFTNDGTEFHEMIVVRITDEDTPLEELMAMPEEETAALSEFVGYVSAFPGTSADGSITLETPGRYTVVCVINQGSDPTRFEAIGFDPMQLDESTDMSTLPPEVQELLAELQSNPTHDELGMFQEFTVTEAGTEVGPLPEADAGEAAAEEEDAPEDEEAASE
jgi:plastocyanin